MRLHSLRISLVMMVALATAACGGGGYAVTLGPPPPSSPPPPTPPPAPGPAVPAAVQTSSPALPVAGTTKFSTLTQATDFPLLMTAAFGGPGNGDPATTSAGGVLKANPNGSYALTISNHLEGFNNTIVPTAQTLVGGNWDIRATVSSGTLDYTRYGYWDQSQPSEGTFYLGAWATGFVTPSANLLLQGTATYAGKASGLYNVAVDGGAWPDFDSSFTGDVGLTANFGQSTLSGSITNITASSFLASFPLTGPVNDIGFSASIDRSNNLFAGTTSVTSQVTGPYAFGPTAGGLINGRFYGPNADEVGAVFNVTDGIRRLIGSFGAKH